MFYVLDENDISTFAFLEVFHVSIYLSCALCLRDTGLKYHTGKMTDDVSISIVYSA
jgi:hypothetical protein